FFFQAEDGIRDRNVTGVQTCALPISSGVIHLRLSAVAARGITATAGNDCPGADRKSFCLLLGKNFCGMYISPLDWRRRLWLSMPPATGLKRYGMAPEREGRKAPATTPSGVGLTSRRFLPGCQERRPRRDRGGATVPVAASRGFHASDRSDSPKPRQRVRRRLAGAPAAACRSRA